MNFSEETSSSALPPVAMLLLLIVATGVGALLGSGLAYWWARWQGFDIQLLVSNLNESSPLPERNAARVINLISHLISFTLSAIFVAQTAYRQHWVQYLQMQRAPSIGNALLGILFVVAAFPFVQLTYWLNSELPLPNWAIEMEKAAETVIKGILVMESPAELLLNIVVIGVAPALGEELVFRGVVQQQFQRIFPRPVWAIWLTAILFSAIHMQFVGFIPRMVLGVTLGYLFYWTKNLWMPIVAHFFINTAQVIVQYASKGQLTQLELEKPDSANWATGLLSLMMTIGIGYYVWRRHNPKKAEPSLNDEQP